MLSLGENEDGCEQMTLKGLKDRLRFLINIVINALFILI